MTARRALCGRRVTYAGVWGVHGGQLERVVPLGPQRRAYVVRLDNGRVVVADRCNLMAAQLHAEVTPC